MKKKDPLIVRSSKTQKTRRFHIGIMLLRRMFFALQLFWHLVPFAATAKENREIGEKFHRSPRVRRSIPVVVYLCLGLALETPRRAPMARIIRGVRKDTKVAGGLIMLIFCILYSDIRVAMFTTFRLEMYRRLVS